ncbi:MAG: DsbA family protein, partial [Campylobacterales bacterium]
MARLSMWKLWILVLLCASVLEAASNKELEGFIGGNLKQNPNVELEKFTVIKRESVKGLSGWDKVEFKMDVKVGPQKMPNSKTDTLYTHKGLIAPELIMLSGENRTKTVSDDQLKTLAAQSVAGNPNVKLKSAEVVKRFPLKEAAGWEAVQMEFALDVNQNGNMRSLSTTEVWFAGKNAVAPEIIRISSGSSLKYGIKGEVKPEHYAAERIIAGDRSGKAKYKIIVFSDPLCPACRKALPGLIDLAFKNPKEVSLYYYHKPVSAVSPVIMKAAIAQKLSGDTLAARALYEKEIKVQSPDEMAVLESYNKVMGTKFTMKDINTPAVLAHFNQDAKAAGELLILGTPSI